MCAVGEGAACSVMRVLTKWWCLNPSQPAAPQLSHVHEEPPAFFPQLGGQRLEELVRLQRTHKKELRGAAKEVRSFLANIQGNLLGDSDSFFGILVGSWLKLLALFVTSCGRTRRRRSAPTAE